MIEHFAYQLRKRPGFVAVDDTTLAVHDRDIATISDFQTKFQLPPLYWLR
jgi:hypothetical protein